MALLCADRKTEITFNASTRFSIIYTGTVGLKKHEYEITHTYQQEENLSLGIDTGEESMKDNFP